MAQPNACLLVGTSVTEIRAGPAACQLLHGGLEDDFGKLLVEALLGSDELVRALQHVPGQHRLLQAPRLTEQRRNKISYDFGNMMILGTR